MGPAAISALPLGTRLPNSPLWRTLPVAFFAFLASSNVSMYWVRGSDLRVRPAGQKKKSRGSNGPFREMTRTSRVMTRPDPVRFENLLSRPDPTREISKPFDPTPPDP